MENKQFFIKWIVENYKGKEPVYLGGSHPDKMTAVHASTDALTGCDTTSKVGSKLSALQAASRCGYELLFSFGNSEISNEMILSAERFLVNCTARKSEMKTFDDLRSQTYHQKSFQLNLEKLPAMSSSFFLHIKRAYLQCHLWIHAPFMETIDIDPIQFGYFLNDGEEIAPLIMNGPSIPDDFPAATV